MSTQIDIKVGENNGRVCTAGKLRDGIFRKRVKKSVHLFRKNDAWGIDAGVVNDTLKYDATEVRVLDEEEGIVYKTTVQNILDNGIYLHFKPHRAQIFLPRKEWDTYKHR